MAYHFHWPMAEIMDLEHPLRRGFIAQIASINARVSGTAGEDAKEDEEW